jgi:hypothetical protein
MSSIDTAASLPPSQSPSSRAQFSEPASQASTYDDSDSIKQFKDDMQAEKEEWLGSTSVDKRKGLASKWYRKLVGKEEGSSLPIHIRNDIRRSAQEAEEKGKEEVVWDELVVFLYWQKKIADAKKQSMTPSGPVLPEFVNEQ